MPELSLDVKRRGMKSKRSYLPVLTIVLTCLTFPKAQDYLHVKNIVARSDSVYNLRQSLFPDLEGKRKFFRRFGVFNVVTGLALTVTGIWIWDKADPNDSMDMNGSIGFVGVAFGISSIGNGVGMLVASESVFREMLKRER